MNPCCQKKVQLSMWLTLHFHERCQWWKSVVNAVGSTARVLKRSWQLQLWIANSWDPWLQIQRFRPLVSAGQTHVILRAKLMTHGANMKIYCEENLPNFLSSNLGELAYNSTGCMCIYIYRTIYPQSLGTHACEQNEHLKRRTIQLHVHFWRSNTGTNRTLCICIYMY